MSETLHQKLRPVTLVKQMYSCGVVKNSLKENCKNDFTQKLVKCYLSLGK